VNRIVVVFALVLLGVLSPRLGLAESEVEASSKPSAIEMTIRRFFSGQSEYQDGDLITRSQVEEFQLYLRRTRQRGPASHPLILKRLLPDNSRLCKVFYLKNGGKVLRIASQKLGGYAGIEALVKSTASYTQLVDAVRSGAADSVVQLVEAAGMGKKLDTTKIVENRKRRKKTIYTVDDFIKAVIVTPEAKTPAEDS